MLVLLPVRAKNKIKVNSIFFWLVALSFVYLSLQHEEIANLVRAGNDHISITPSSQYYTNSNSHPKALRIDLVFQAKGWTTPVVIRQYKLIFFPIPKVACTDWKLLFRRMEGQPEWNTTGLNLHDLHNPIINNLTTLDQIPLDEAQHILTSSEWTRAVFLREPKERLLSAFLDKFVNKKQFFRNKCCQQRYNASKEECRRRQEDSQFSYFLNRTLDCLNDHWNPQYSMIDAKWWDTINFVGYLDNVFDDAKKSLQSITFIEDRMPAWEQYRRTGWGYNGTGTFMQRDTASHATNAHDKLRSYYTREDEQFVEKYLSGEWNHSAYHFTPIHLFGNSTTSHSKDGLKNRTHNDSQLWKDTFYYRTTVHCTEYHSIQYFMG